MDNDVETSGSKNILHLVPAKLAVQKECQFFKRLQRG